VKEEVRRSPMESSPKTTVWINPPKYWAATHAMTDEQKTQLLEQVERLVLAGDVSALRNYEFVELNPMHPGRQSSKQNTLQS
jgi:hypothetical protein